MKINLGIKLGIGAGIINSIAWYVIANSLGYYSFAVEQYRYYATLLLLLFGITISIYLERKNKGGFIDFKAAAKCGVLFSVALSLILAAFSYIYYKFIIPDAVDYFVSEARKSMIEGKMTEENITKSLETVISYFGFFRMFMSTLILGVILSLIAGGLLRKKNPQPFSGN
ncbi:MAG: DUF4199 domain-containing protein [Bacteroidetes bacterium]|nr:DUF4199 domain-containing protein [Bacteroidota bacterium]